MRRCDTCGGPCGPAWPRILAAIARLLQCVRQSYAEREAKARPVVAGGYYAAHRYVLDAGRRWCPYFQKPLISASWSNSFTASRVSTSMRALTQPSANQAWG